MELIVAVVAGVLIGSGVALLLVRGRQSASQSASQAVSAEMRRAVDALAAQNRAALDAERWLAGQGEH